MPRDNLHLEIQRGAHERTRLVEQPLADLARGQVRLRVERFALTANNVTYAVAGDLLGYWSFFPTPGADEGWGRVPAMGFGEVVASAHPDVEAGGRYYGWFPMSRFVEIEVAPTGEGLRDEGAHRAAHAPIYRGYARTDRDPFHQPGGDAEDRLALLRGLFLTAFLADDFFAERDYFGATRAVVLSASSKTAIGFAQRASARGLSEVVGLTSAANLAFVAGLPWYDRALPYEEIESIGAGADAVAVDMAGSGELLARVHGHLRERLRYSMSVGLSHHDAPPRPEGLPGPKPELFFAPAQAGSRLAAWGAAGFQERVGAALAEFVGESRRWLSVERACGSDAARASWLDVLGGRVPPSVGRIVSLWDEVG